METPQNDPIPNESRPPSQMLWMLALLAAFLIGLGAGYLVWVRPLETQLAELKESNSALMAEQTTRAQQEAQAQADTEQQPVQRYTVPIDDDPVLGSDEAKITIIEFSDYECPFCRRWHQEVFPQIRAKYGDQVRFVYRDFPLYSIHPNAGPAAEAANCAGEQGKYWEFNERLFNSEQLGPSVYTAHGQALGLDMDAFQSCIDSGRTKAEVDADYAYASELGVRSTPTFFVNGLAIVGAQPFEVFEQVIDMELAGEIP